VAESGVAPYPAEEAQGGHIEPGCEVAYLAELVIHKFNELKMMRHFDAERRIKLLGVKK
jgi:predicted DNA-binding protein with PD1-like motif